MARIEVVECDGCGATEVPGDGVKVAAVVYRGRETVQRDLCPPCERIMMEILRRPDRTVRNGGKPPSAQEVRSDMAAALEEQLQRVRVMAADAIGDPNADLVKALRDISSNARRS